MELEYFLGGSEECHRFYCFSDLVLPSARRKLHPSCDEAAADNFRVLLRVVLLGLRVLEVEVHVAVVVVVLLSEGRPVPAQMSSNVITRYQILSGLQLTLPNLFWKCWQNAALFRLYRHRYSQVSSHLHVCIDVTYSNLTRTDKMIHLKALAEIFSIITSLQISQLMFQF